MVTNELVLRRKLFFVIGLSAMLIDKPIDNML